MAVIPPVYGNLEVLNVFAVYYIFVESQNMVTYLVTRWLLVGYLWLLVPVQVLRQYVWN